MRVCPEDGLHIDQAVSNLQTLRCCVVMHGLLAVAHRAGKFAVIGIAEGVRDHAKFTPGDAQRTRTAIRGGIGKFEVPSGVL